MDAVAQDYKVIHFVSAHAPFPDTARDREVVDGGEAHHPVVVAGKDLGKDRGLGPDRGGVQGDAIRRRPGTMHPLSTTVRVRRAVGITCGWATT